MPGHPSFPGPRWQLCSLIVAFIWPSVLARAQDGPPAAPEVLLSETAALLENGGFEAARADSVSLPAGWQVSEETNRWRLDADQKLAGNFALRVDPGDTPLEAASVPVDVDTSLKHVSGFVMVHGSPDAIALLRWWAQPAAVGTEQREPPLREDVFTPVGTGEGWRRLVLTEQIPPEGSRTLQVVLSSPAGELPTFWDQANLSGLVEKQAKIRLLLNQVGYEVAAPKSFTVTANFPAQQASFRVKDVSDAEILSGTLEGGSDIQSASGPSWGGYYWRGDFSQINNPGSYLIEVELDGHVAESAYFDLDVDLIWNHTFDLAWRCFSLHRCGAQVQGIHAACHLDDTALGIPLSGGWHDGTHYGKQNNPYFLWKLGEVHDIIGWRLRARNDAASPTPLYEELAWGVDLLARTVREDGSVLPLPIGSVYWGAPELETDNLPDTGDERALEPLSFGLSGLQGSALARAGLSLPAPQQAVDTAARAAQHMQGNPLQAPWFFSTLFNLWRQDPDEDLLQRVHASLPQEPQLQIMEELVQYEGRFAVGVLMHVVMKAQAEADAIVARAANPFGLYPYTGGTQNFFRPVTHPHDIREGNTTHILEAAETVAKAYRLIAKREYLEFVYHQLNWVLGLNPYGICLLAGVGSEEVPSYHHPYVTTGVRRGAVPGVIANGFAARGPEDDRPYFDVSGSENPYAGTNGVSLKNTALYLSVLAHIKRTPMSREQAGQPVNPAATVSEAPQVAPELEPYADTE